MPLYTQDEVEKIINEKINERIEAALGKLGEKYASPRQLPFNEDERPRATRRSDIMASATRRHVTNREAAAGVLLMLLLGESGAKVSEALAVLGIDISAHALNQHLGKGNVRSDLVVYLTMQIEDLSDNFELDKTR